MPDLRQRLRLALAAAATPVLSACSPITLVNAASVAGAGKRITDIAYGQHPRRRLDVYLPHGAAPSAGWPTVLFFYGGSWNQGERADYRFVGEALASRGILTVIADYRLYPEVRWPAFLEDGAAALAWIRRQAADAGAAVDPARVHLMGHSAGAYNAAMLALDPRWLKGQGLQPGDLAGWIGLAGPYDFLPLTNTDAQPVFFHPDYPPDTQPLALARAGSPRAFLGAAIEDKLVNPRRSTLGLSSRLKELGVPVTTRMYERVDHVTVLGALSRPLRWMAPVLADVSRFILDPAAA